MRRYLFAAALFVSVPALCDCCGTYGAGSVKIEGTVTAALVRGDHLFALTDRGDLLRLADPVTPPQVLGRFEMKLGPAFAVDETHALLTAQNRVYVADLARRQIIAAQVFDAPVSAVGFGDQGRFYVLQAGAVHVLEIATARKIGSVAVGDKDDHRAPLAAGQMYGGRLHVVVAGQNPGLAIVDLEALKVQERMPIEGLNLGSGYHSVRELRIRDGKAYMVCLRFSYGVWTENFGYLDLKSRRFTNLKLQNSMMGASRIADGPAGSMFLLHRGDAYRYDQDGKLSRTAQAKGAEQILTMWHGAAVTSSANAINLVPLTTKTAAGE